MKNYKNVVYAIYHKNHNGRYSLTDQEEHDISACKKFIDTMNGNRIAEDHHPLQLLICMDCIERTFDDDGVFVIERRSSRALEVYPKDLQ